MRTFALAAIAALGLALTTTVTHADPFCSPVPVYAGYPVTPVYTPPYRYVPAPLPPCRHYHHPVSGPVYYPPTAPVLVPAYPRPCGGPGFSFSLNIVK